MLEDVPLETGAVPVDMIIVVDIDVAGSGPLLVDSEVGVGKLKV
jgi:hypothetical protein